MTPEGRVKAKVNKALAQWANVYRFMPVPTGYGATTLDYLLCVNEHFVGIETKKPGGKLTPRQEATAAEIRTAGGDVLVIDGDLTEFNALMNRYTERKYHITPEAGRRAKLKNRHGITPEQYDELLVKQDGHCYFCTRTPDKEPHGVLCVDHDHVTRRLRGLVCRVHNHALWNFGDNVDGFEKALAYVKGS